VETGAVLFDQNAGKHGSLIDNFGRLCSLTNLPELMTKSASAIPVFTLPKRLDFFVTKLELYELSKSRNVSLQANNLLKKIMTVDHDGYPNGCGLMLGGKSTSIHQKNLQSMVEENSSQMKLKKNLFFLSECQIGLEM
jgi:hypothetical protein